MPAGAGSPVEAELIPDEEWGRGMQDPAYVPGALPLSAALGRSGELVVSVQNHAHPVVRFRTQERVRVMEVSGARGIRVERLPSALPAPTDLRPPARHRAAAPPA